GLIPDLGDAGFHRLAAIARDQLAIAARAELAGGDLRAQIAEARIRIAHIVANDLPPRLLAPAGFLDLERADLQTFAIYVVRGGRAEALVHAADIDPVRAVGREAHDLAGMEAGRIDHHIVEMLAAHFSLIHNHHVARREAVEPVARNAI